MNNKRHGGTGTRLYDMWKNIKKRCNNKNNPLYIHYGGRGIKISADWDSNFVAFRDWATNNGFDPTNKSISIDRIDNNAGYFPDNCRFVDRKIQSQNTRLLKSTNKTGFRGVYLRKGTCRYVAQIRVNNEKINLGSHDTAIKGAKAYNNYVLKHNLEHTINIIPQRGKNGNKR